MTTVPQGSGAESTHHRHGRPPVDCYSLYIESESTEPSERRIAPLGPMLHFLVAASRLLRLPPPAPPQPPLRSEELMCTGTRGERQNLIITHRHPQTASPSQRQGRSHDEYTLLDFGMYRTNAARELTRGYGTNQESGGRDELNQAVERLCWPNISG